MKRLALLFKRGGVLTPSPCCASRRRTHTVTLEIYRSDNNTTPVLTAQFPRSGEPPINRPGVWQWSWDGRLADGSLAERGVYLYRVRASTRCLFVTDGDSNRSDYLRIERAQDASGQPILEAAYWGYDDHSTPEDESDDEHLYFVRWYALRSENDVNPAANWREDLDYFVIAGCSVLRPDAVNGFAWGNATLKAGILRGLCGYHDVAPLDSSGIPEQIAADFALMIRTASAPNHTHTGDQVLNAWLEANLRRQQNGIVYNATAYWRIARTLGIEYIEGPIPW